MVLFEEGAAEWPATGLENRGGSRGQGFDSFTLLQVRVAAAETVDRAGL